jgi:hypothetical protein
MGIVSDVKKALGIGGGGRAAQINAATDNAVNGVPTEGATIGNPTGKKKKLKPTSSKIPTTLRG